MRLVFSILLVGLIALTCGPNSNESVYQEDDSVSISGHVYRFEEVLDKPMADVWVVLSRFSDEHAFGVRFDSVLTNDIGEFSFDSVAPGVMFYELYREPRIDCWAGGDTLSFFSDASGLVWPYDVKPGCERVGDPYK